MSIYQIAAPDLAPLAVGGTTLHLLEGLGFSQDGKSLLVRATFTDDADTSAGVQHHGVWLYDLATRQYTRCLNTELAGSAAAAKQLDINSASIVGAGSSTVMLAETRIHGSTEPSKLAWLGGAAVDLDLLATVLGPDIQPRVEGYSLSQDGRFLALQTDSALLAPNDSPDINDSSDIYLLDLLTHRVARVSFVGGSEVTLPTYLGNVITFDGKVQVAFSTDAAFTSADRNATSSDPTDAYLWSSSFGATGLTGSPTFSLASAIAQASGGNQASGLVDADSPVVATPAGVFFSSGSDDLISSDTNGALDAFLKPSVQATTRVTLSGHGELDAGASFLSASNNGRFVALATGSSEVSGAPGVQQMVVLDRQTGAWHVASQNGNVLANDLVVGGVMAPNGAVVAFTSAADNLSATVPVALGGSLFVATTGFDTNTVPTGSVSITGAATQGQTLTASNMLADVDGIPASGTGSIVYQWLADGTAIDGASGDTLVLGQAQVGKTITVTASYTDGQGTAESKTSAATAAVANVDDEASATLGVTGTAAEGGTLTATLSSVSDADGMTSTAWQWQISSDGSTGWTDLSGATAAAYAIASDQSQVGKYLRVVATTTDALGGTSTFTGNASAQIANVNDAPTGSVTIGGTATQGQTLTATNTLADADGLGTIGYQWKADGTDISGATGSSYTLTQAEVGKAITVTASYTDGQGTAESVPSAQMPEVVQSAHLEGMAYHWKSHALLNDVTIRISGSDGDFVSHSVQGSFDFNGLSAEGYRLTASRDAVDQEQTITVSDALAALRIVKALNPNPDPDGAGPLAASPLSPYQIMAADVDGDTKVTMADVAAILRMAVKAEGATAQQWCFVEESRDFWDETSALYTLTAAEAGWDPAIQIKVDANGGQSNLVAVLKGDVNGSWAAPNGSEYLADAYFDELAALIGVPAGQWGI